MAYATVEELAEALRVKNVTPELGELYAACLEAAAVEIDDAVDRDEPIPEGDPLANRVNVLRGVEWVKAADSTFGIIGSSETGALRAPRDSFARHAATLLPLKTGFGVA